MNPKSPVRLKSGEVKTILIDEEEHKKELPSVINNDNSPMALSMEEHLDSNIDHLNAKKKRFSWLKIGVVSVSVLAAIQLVDGVVSALAFNAYLGGALLAVLVGFLGWTGLQVLKLLRNRKVLTQQEQTKRLLAEYNRPESHGKTLPVIKALHQDRAQLQTQDYQRFLTESHIAQDDNELLHLYNRIALSPLDKQAKQVITKHATDCAMMVALSPYAAVDMALVLWRNTKMIEEVSRIYGLDGVPFSKMQISKRVAKNMMLVGAQELVMDASFESLGLSLGTKLSTRAAQGIGAGLLTLRVGLYTLDYCRPVDFIDGDRPKISHLRKDIIAQVKERLLTLQSKGD